nr:MAG TPA: ERF superfamily protein [Caudoviricetes sp.]
MSKLVEIQAELKVPKNQRNTFGKYNYRSAEDILEAVKPLLKKHDAKITLSDKLTLVGDWHYVEATARFVCGDEVETVTAYARESLNKKGMDESQITGTASSYARKYALNGLLLIDDTKDADTDEYKKQTNQNANSHQAKQYISVEKAKQYKEDVQAIIKATNINDGSIMGALLKKTKATMIEKITTDKQADADDIIAAMKQKAGI